VQQRGEAAIVGLEEGLENQTDEQLRLGVELGAEWVGVGAQNLGGDHHGFAGNIQRRFGQRTHTILYVATVPRVREVFYRAVLTPFPSHLFRPILRHAIDSANSAEKALIQA
jgi:hypothetical protein